MTSPPSSVDTARTAKESGPCRFVVRALHVFVLLNLALTARLYDLLARQPMFFVARRSESVDVVLLVLALSVLLPALVVLGLWLAGLPSRRFGWWCHLVVMWLSLAAIVAAALKPAQWLGGSSALWLAASLGALAAAAYARFAAARTAVTILSPAVILFPAIFLFGSPVLTLLTTTADPPVLDVEVGRPAPVIMVVFDEFCGTSLINEHHRIDSVRYPNFAALADHATWFRNATTTSPSTQHAICSLVTGKFPRGFEGIPVASQFPHSLFTLLGNSHRFEVREGDTALCPARLAGRDTPRAGLLSRLRSLMIDVAVLELHLLLPEDGPVTLPDVTGRWGNFLGQDQDQDHGARPNIHVRRREQFEEFVRCMKPSPRPGLYFAHVMLPHVPWTYTPSGREYSLPLYPEDHKRLLLTHEVVGLRRGSERWADDELAVVQAHQRYLLQVGFVDRLIGELTSHLEQVGLYDRSLIVITADHGVSFRPGKERRAMDDVNYPDVMSIPLLVKLPHQRNGAVSDRNVQSIDVLPTIADALQIAMPWKADGDSLVDPSAPQRAQKEIAPDEESDDRMAFDGAFEEKYRTLREMLALFGSGGKPGGLYSVGPHRELIGRSVDEFAPALPSSCAIRLANAECYADVDPDGRLLPCYIGGRIFPDGETPWPIDLAIAVDGTIRAVTRTFLVDGFENTWAAMVPEQAFRPGENRVQVFVVSSRDGQLHLTETTRTVSDLEPTPN